MKEASSNESANVAQVISTVVGLIRPLAGELGVEVITNLPDDSLPRLAVHPCALQEGLLSVLVVALRRVPGGQIVLHVQPADWEIHISVEASSPRQDPEPTGEDDSADLNMARRLLEMFGATLKVQNVEAAFAATLGLPVLGQLPVLAIDDSEDSLQLLERYASGTRYRIIGAQDPEQVLTLLEQTSPLVIVLDLMMPKIDGWQLLGRLRQHPLSRHLPIIVYTILPRKELALTLGATDFLQKPVTRQTVLDALDHQVLAAIAAR